MAKTTLKDVAKLAGVNFTLVSKYINNNPSARMTLETKEKIQKAIEELDYHPSKVARALRSGKTNTVGLLIGNLTNKYFAHSLEIALEEFQKRGYQLLISVVDFNTPKAAIQNLLSHNVDAIYSFIAADKEIEDLKIPVPVIFNIPNKKYSTVTLDAKTSLVTGLKTLGIKEIEGIFAAPNLWTDIFTAACHEADCKVTVNKVALDKVKRAQEILAICQKRSKYIFANGWETTCLLQDVIKDQLPSYRPNLLLHANCSGPFFADKQILGVITSSSRELIIKSCETLIHLIENPHKKVIHETIPASFVLASDIVYSRFITKHFSLI